MTKSPPHVSFVRRREKRAQKERTKHKQLTRRQEEAYAKKCGMSVTAWRRKHHKDLQALFNERNMIPAGLTCWPSWDCCSPPNTEDYDEPQARQIVAWEKAMAPGRRGKWRLHEW